MLRKGHTVKQEVTGDGDKSPNTRSDKIWKGCGEGICPTGHGEQHGHCCKGARHALTTEEHAAVMLREQRQQAKQTAL